MEDEYSDGWNTFFLNVFRGKRFVFFLAKKEDKREIFAFEGKS